ncbi:MAG: aminobenzoyl-glutamate utilization protein A, partial [Natronomonas sp.]
MATDSTARVDEDWLRSLRREFHQHPEPAWREFWTTARVVEELDSMGVDDVLVGPEVLADGERSALPDADELAAWHEQAREAGADPDLLERMEGGYTGALATVERGEGPTVALRVDIDGLPRAESESEDHHPAQAGFRSVNEGAMHACGHDAHASIGLGVLRAVLDSDFRGTFKLLFQPSEEMI